MPSEPRRFERLYGVVGDPLGHSLSPALHNWGFSLGRIPGVYMPFAKNVAELPGFVTAIRTLPFHGVSVTLPHKSTIIPHLDEISERAARIGAVNTLYWREGRLIGENTDILGVLTPLCGKPLRKTLMLGAGGAALAVLNALEELNAQHIIVALRDPAKFPQIALRPNVELVPWEDRVSCMDESLDLVLNTTPIGMAGRSPDESPVPTEAWHRVSMSCTAFDLVYNPLATRFLRDASAAGLHLQDGLDFFVAQGLEQFRLWTGLMLPVGAARVFLEYVLKAWTDQHRSWHE
jgi:shikimate dehydrogenase